jgi:hypothetical protein
MRYESFFLKNDSILLTDILEPNIKNLSIFIKISNFGNKISKITSFFFLFQFVFSFFDKLSCLRKALDEELGPCEAPKKIKAGLFASQKWLHAYGSSYHDSSWPSLINLVAATRLSTSRFHIDLTMMMMNSLQNEVSYQIIHGLGSY